MTIQIRYFASLRDRLGRAGDELPSATEWTVASIWAALHPETPPPAPPGNPVTPAKAQLGKVLFWDEQLSSTRTVSCGTCHIPAAGGDDPRSASGPLAVHPGPDGVFGGPDDVFGSPGVPLNQADGSYSWQASFGLLPQVTPRRTVSSLNAGLVIGVNVNERGVETNRPVIERD